MKMRRTLFFLFLMIIMNPVNGQEGESSLITILFKGIVMDAGTLKPVSNAQIFVNNRFNAVSGNDGIFGLYVRINDTLMFSSLGYLNTTMIVSDSLKGKDFAAGVYMKTDTTEIGEVIIIPRNTNLRSEIMNSRSTPNQQMENAKYNVAISAYQGRTTTGSLGDPSSNYEMLRQRQRTDAYEKGGIPSDRILGLSPFMLVPAAYLLIHGLPTKPSPYKSDISASELEEMNRRYLDHQKRK